MSLAPGCRNPARDARDVDRTRRIDLEQRPAEAQRPVFVLDSLAKVVQPLYVEVRRAALADPLLVTTHDLGRGTAAEDLDGRRADLGDPRARDSAEVRLEHRRFELPRQREHHLIRRGSKAPGLLDVRRRKRLLDHVFRHQRQTELAGEWTRKTGLARARRTGYEDEQSLERLTPSADEVDLDGGAAGPDLLPPPQKLADRRAPLVAVVLRQLVHVRADEPVGEARVQPAPEA